MATVDLVMPKMGESIMEATILKWHKQPGDPVQQDETVLEIATDKVDTEVPSTAEGVMAEILFKENDVVPVGTVIARIQTEVEENTTAPQPQPSIQESRFHDAGYKIQDEGFNLQEEQMQTSAATTYRPDPIESSGRVQTTNGIGNRFYSPLVLNIASSEGVSLSELEKIHGTGNEGRVTKKDILQYVSDRRTGKSPGSQSSSRSQYPAFVETEELEERNLQTRSQSGANNQLPTVYTGNVEIIEMDRMRKLIADHMVRSKHTSPHVTSFTEADVTNLVMWREKVKKEFEKEKERRSLSRICL